MKLGNLILIAGALIALTLMCLVYAQGTEVSVDILEKEKTVSSTFSTLNVPLPSIFIEKGEVTASEESATIKLRCCMEKEWKEYNEFKEAIEQKNYEEYLLETISINEEGDEILLEVRAMVSGSAKCTDWATLELKAGEERTIKCKAEVSKDTSYELVSDVTYTVTAKKLPEPKIPEPKKSTCTEEHPGWSCQCKMSEYGGEWTRKDCEDENECKPDLCWEGKDKEYYCCSDKAAKNPPKDRCGNEKYWPEGILPTEWSSRLYKCIKFPKSIYSDQEAKIDDTEYECIYGPNCDGAYCCKGGPEIRCCKEVKPEKPFCNVKYVGEGKESPPGQPIPFEVSYRGITHIECFAGGSRVYERDLEPSPFAIVSHHFSLSPESGKHTLNCIGITSKREKVDCEGEVEFNVATPEQAKGEGMPWWQIPCLRFIKEPGSKTWGKWGPFTSWMDWAWTGISALAAGAFVLSQDKEYRCVPEQPLDVDACEECEKDPYRICTKERCAILGRNCYAVEREDGKGYHCFTANCTEEEKNLTKIVKINFSWYASLVANTSEGSAGIESNQLNVTKELPWNVSHAVLSIELDKEAKCRYAVDKFEANFSEMLDFEGNERYPTKQSVSMPLTGMKPGDHWIIIKCRNKCGGVNPAEDDSNWVRFKIGEIPEGIPPMIDYLEPESGFISSAQRYINVTLWLNENGMNGNDDSATCKYSTIVNNLTLNWSDMFAFNAASHPDGNNSVYEGKCENDKKCRAIEKEQCAHCTLSLDLGKGFLEHDPEAMLSMLKKAGIELNVSAEAFGALIGSQKGKIYPFMFRCQDTQGNKNEGDYYLLIAVDPFNITIIKPPVDDPYERYPEIEVETKSGNVSRATRCKYSVLEGNVANPDVAWDQMRWIDEVLSNRHIGKVEKELLPGSWTLYVKCRDEARIQAANWTYFTILQDTKAPRAIRSYHYTKTGDYLLIETDEPSECVYGTASDVGCAYNFSDGSVMSSTDSFTHVAYWQLDHLYYIKCKDKWNNYPGGSPSANNCTTIISPYEVPAL